jgi:glyoxylase-like metal-dependent hydrolase (beta-lactamase superfamily II)
VTIIKHKTAGRHDTALPAAGTTLEVAPGLHWLRFSLPFALDHINVWLLDGPKGWTIIDSGFNQAESIAEWEQVLAAQMPPEKIENIFITHFHPDHFGLAGWLADKNKNATIHMTPAEWHMVQALTDPDSADRLEEIYRPYYTQSGVPDDLLETLIDRRMGYKKIIHAPPAAVSHVHPDDTITLAGRDWQIIGGYGHSPEHASLYNAKDNILIAGDMVLPYITPNISFFPGNSQGEDPVGAYLDTLARIADAVPDDALVLPSHGIPFQGLRKRTDQITAHHHQRLEKLHAVLKDNGPQTGYAAMQGLFAHRELKTGDVFFALGETLAHLIYSLRRGEVIETMEEGRILYQLKTA